MSLELANVSARKGEVKYLFVNLGCWANFSALGSLLCYNPHPLPLDLLESTGWGKISEKS